MKTFTSACLLVPLLFTGSSIASQPSVSVEKIDAIVNGNIHDLMKEQAIPGMAVGVIFKGKTYTFTYGLADKGRNRPVTTETLFELGSVSKTFTGLTGALSSLEGNVSLNAPVQTYQKTLPDIPWKKITMLNLATYTAGGLPLQLPDGVTDEKSLEAYYLNWQPSSAPGTVRSYSNASIGLFGLLAVKNSGQSFEQYLTTKVLQPLNLSHTYVRVPAAEEKNYAWGYRNDQPLRVSSGMLDAEAYGIKSSIADMVSYTAASMAPESLRDKPAIQRAMMITQSRYFVTGDMYQGLGWEMYNWPVSENLIARESHNDVALKPSETRAMTPPGPFNAASWVHKTGSTNGFGAYVAFIPQEKIGIVMLANKSYPNPIRVETARRIIDAVLSLEEGRDSASGRND